MKPKKIIYENQAEVWGNAKKYLLNLISNQPCVKEAIVWASLAEGTFGVYEEEYRGQEGSDIDLVLIIDEEYPIPKQWKFTKIKKSWFDLYSLGKFVHIGHIHNIDGLLVFPSRHNLEKMKSSLKGRSKIIYVK